MSYQLTIEPLGATIEVDDGQSVLDAALRAAETAYAEGEITLLEWLESGADRVGRVDGRSPGAARLRRGRLEEV